MIAWIENLLLYLLAFIPLAEEHIIIALLVAGVLLLVIAGLILARNISLSTSLSVAKANQFILEQKPVAPVEISENSMPPLELGKKDSVQKKRTIVTVTLPEEAQQLLDKIAVNITYDDNWQGAPGITFNYGGKNIEEVSS